MDYQSDQQNDNTQAVAASGGVSDEDRADADKLMELADEFGRQADELSRVMEDAGAEYEAAVQPDVQAMSTATDELEVISHEADLDDARSDIDAAVDAVVPDAASTAPTPPPVYDDAEAPAAAPDTNADNNLGF